MRIIVNLIVIVFLLLTGFTYRSFPHQERYTYSKADTAPVYVVRKLKKPMVINANWEKRQWKKVKALDIIHHMGAAPKFTPKSQAKMMYDDENVYIIFRTEDQFMRSTVETVNGGVSADACVEFFFAPDEKHPDRYFHLEANSIGTPFMAYDTIRRRDIKFTPEEMKQIHVVSSYPKKIDPEMAEPLTWTLECKIPIELLRRYSPDMTIPRSGAAWKANFYKTASRSSNRHYLTWAVVDLPRPDFHQPKFFSTIQFK